MTAAYLATETDLLYVEDDPERDEEIDRRGERAEFAPDTEQIEPNVALFLEHAKQINDMKWFGCRCPCPGDHPG